MMCHVSGGIFFKLVEGKDRPKERGKPYFEADCGAIGGLVMRETKPIFGTGKAAVIDSIICVLRGLVRMLAHWVYGTTVIKKNIYWPK